ncbi:RidA family protein [Cesiribacter sp. SM1]|uniref:RidA family protein n=1 Tax=Cesiribacter sp. SM1 TaxID=2861196 RepID=UPI001CD5602B|nr:RidA family protein [Cesiribacter sp. SM1]
MNTPSLLSPNVQRVSSGSVWEPLVGYSRAIRWGNIIEVAGTTAVKGGMVVGEGDPYEQTRRILQIIGDALQQLGADFKNVVRTRIFVTDIKQWEEVARAHGEVFGEIRPACTMVEVAALIDPALMVEIEATAIVNT